MIIRLSIRSSEALISGDESDVVRGELLSNGLWALRLAKNSSCSMRALTKVGKSNSGSGMMMGVPSQGEKMCLEHVWRLEISTA